MKCILDLKKLFNSLQPFKYACIKVDAPYVPKDFPNNYAVGKDLDIIILKDDCSSVKNVLSDFTDVYRDKFNIRWIEDPYGFRVRYENSKLHFQFDVKYMIEGLSEKFISDLLNTRKLISFKKSIYGVPKVKYEIVIRMLADLKNKPHHMEYLRDNLSFWDLDIVPDKLKTTALKIMKEIKG